MATRHDDIAAILQTRMGSTRLPGKAMMPIINGKSVLELMLERVRRARRITRLIVATTNAPEDDAIERLCVHLEMPCFRGSENDVLDRFYQAALANGTPKIIVRLTGDCPLCDPGIIDAVIERLFETDADYASNVEPPSFPDGLDVEVMKFSALETAWRDATLLSEREHVTPHIRKHPERFRLSVLLSDKNLSGERWTLDEPADLVFIRAVYQRLYPAKPTFGMNDVLALLDAEPELRALNRGMVRNAGYLKSLAEDKEKHDHTTVR